MTKNTQMMLTFSPQQMESIEKLQEEHGFLSKADAIRYCVVQTTKKPAYALVEERRQKTVKLSPLEKAEQAEATEEAKLQKKREKQLKLVEALGGTVDAADFCWYPRYEMPSYDTGRVAKEVINVQLMDLRPIDLIEQWRGDDGKPTDRAIVEAQIAKYGTTG